MMTQEPEQLDRIFAALAHPVRRTILEQCSDGRQSVAELAEPHSLSLNAVSKHIKTLEAAELVRREQEGNFHRISIEAETLKPVLDWLSYHAALWSNSLHTLKSKLENSV